MAPVGCMCLMWYFLVVAIHWSIVSLSKTNLVSSKQRDTQNTDVSTAGKSTAFWTPSHGGGWLIFLLKLGGFLGSFLRSFFSGVVPPSASFGFNPATKIRFQSPVIKHQEAQIACRTCDHQWWMFCGWNFEQKTHIENLQMTITTVMCMAVGTGFLIEMMKCLWRKTFGKSGEDLDDLCTPLKVGERWSNVIEIYRSPVIFGVISRTQVNYLYLVFMDLFSGVLFA